jgi:ABC-2 type transport system permease protein
MNPMNKIETIVRKEWAEIFKNRMVLFTVLLLPLIMTSIPVAILFAMNGQGDMADLGGLTAEMAAYCPPNVTGGDCLQVYMVSQMMLLFMILPLVIPATIAAYSIVGEKTTRSLEPLLATPITTSELLIGKALAAVIPGVAATLAGFGIFALAAAFIVSNRVVLAALFDARWLIAVIVVGPLMAVLGVMVSVMVSSRVNDPRVAEQISALVILPVLGVFFGQMAGLFILNQQLILLVAVILLVIDAGAILLAGRVFQREAILTRWK